MATFGVVFALDGIRVTPPEEVVWSRIIIGDAGSGLDKRSPYQWCEWRKQVDLPCYMDWHDYDNTVLTSFISTMPDHDDYYETYTDAICKSVGHRKVRDASLELVARFLVYTG